MGCSFICCDLNKLPASFAVRGSIPLSQDQVNSNGAVPSGFVNPGFQFSVVPSQDPNAQ